MTPFAAVLKRNAPVSVAPDMTATADANDGMGEGSPITDAAFAALMQPLGPFQKGETVAVAVSGGPDSMALTRLVRVWAEYAGLVLVGLTVDHRLRSDAAREAEQVKTWFNGLNLDHHTLVWDDGDKIGQLDRSPQAAAREARFDLMSRWCRDHGVQTVLVAHHADDQAETFLQRLLRGSGVDGLAAMSAKTVRQNIQVVRPLLNYSKADLEATCRAHKQSWIEDPSNVDEQFSRVRVRKLLAALQIEGLSSERLLDTVGHMQRAKAAIDHAVEKVFEQAKRPSHEGALELDLPVLMAAPEEVGLRCLARSLCDVSAADYPPRFERLSRVYHALDTADWSDRTLHGCQLRVSGDVITITPEAKERQNSA